MKRHADKGGAVHTKHERTDGKAVRVTRRLFRLDVSPQGRTTKRSIVVVGGGEALGRAHGTLPAKQESVRVGHTLP